MNVKNIIKEKVSIEDVAESLNLDLYKQGNTLRGHCPTGHDSKSGNCFSIVQDKNYWHCFHCGEGGDSISLVEKAKGIEFKDALRWIVEKFMPELLQQINGKYKPLTDEEKAIYRKAEYYEAIYEAGKKALYESPKAEPALKFLTEVRGYSLDKLKKTEWVYWPEETEIRRFLVEKFPDARAYVTDRKFLPLQGHYGDKFRLAFPYRDKRGVITGFIKRNLSLKGETIKTFDGKEHTKIRWDSTKEVKKWDLFNIHSCRRKEEVVIVEGYPDALYLKTEGLDNITAVGQGEISHTHIKNLEEFKVKRAVISFDNDPLKEGATIPEGIKNTENAVHKFKNSNVSLFIVDPPKLSPYKDPDELFRGEGTIEPFRKLVNEAEPAEVWYGKLLLSRYNPNNYKEKETLITKSQEFYCSLPTHKARQGEDFLQVISKATGYSKTHILAGKELDIRQAVESKMPAPVEKLPQIKKTLLDYTLKPGDLDMPETWLIKDVIAYEAIYLFYCKSGGGKSYFTQILSLFANEEKKIDTVIYLDKDNGKQALRVRKMTDIVTGRENYYYIPSFKFDKDFTDTLFEELKTGKYGKCLIVFDSLRNFMNGKDPNTDKDSVQFMTKIQELRDMGHTIFILHHVNKAGIIKNNTSFQDFSDEVFEIIPSKDEENDRLFLEFIKRKERIGGLTKFVAIINCKEMAMIVNEGGISPEDIDTVTAIQEIIKEEHTINQDSIWKEAKDSYGYSHKGEIQGILAKYKGICWNCQKGPKNAQLYSIREDTYKNILSYKLINNNNNIFKIKTSGKLVNSDTVKDCEWSTVGKLGKLSDSKGLDKKEDTVIIENGVNTEFTKFTREREVKNGVDTEFTSLPDISKKDLVNWKNENNSTGLNKVQCVLTQENSIPFSVDIPPPPELPPEKVRCADCKFLLEVMHETEKVYCDKEGNDFNPDFYPDDLHYCQYFQLEETPF